MKYWKGIVVVFVAGTICFSFPGLSAGRAAQKATGNGSSHLIDKVAFLTEVKDDTGDPVRYGRYNLDFGKFTTFVEIKLSLEFPTITYPGKSSKFSCKIQRVGTQDGDNDRAEDFQFILTNLKTGEREYIELDSRGPVGRGGARPPVQLEARWIPKKKGRYEISFTYVYTDESHLNVTDRLLCTHTFATYGCPFEVFQKKEEKSLAGQSLSSYIYTDKNYRKAKGKISTEIAELNTPEDARNWQKQLRKSYIPFITGILGGFPVKDPPVPPVQITGILDRDRYTIKKVIIESRPNFHVTANLYVPKGRLFPQPGILFVMGHSMNGKACVPYHSCCLGLVLKGYVVLAIDPVGQGERSQYIDKSNAWKVPFPVHQHMAIVRPSFLVGQTLVGYRIWDAIRCLDYFLTLPEVDKTRIGIAGNSGGGIMAPFIAGVDERIHVVAGASGGGECEESCLNGRKWPQSALFSLVPPRPLRSTYGEKERHHRSLSSWVGGPYLEELYTKLGLTPGKHCDHVIVAGAGHDLSKPKRERVYEWFNRFLGKEEEGKAEPALSLEPEANLLCTKSGQVGWEFPDEESCCSLNKIRMEAILPQRLIPKNPGELEAEVSTIKNAVSSKLGVYWAEDRSAPKAEIRGKLPFDGYSVEKILYKSESEIRIPGLLFQPERYPRSILVIHTSEFGKPRSKPRSADLMPLPIFLARSGYSVFSIDVRGAGELNPYFFEIKNFKHGKGFMGYDHDCPLRAYDTLATNAVSTGKTLLAMQAYDVIRAVDYIRSRKEFAKRKIVVVGEGCGGLWSMVAASLDKRISRVVAIKTLPSYKLLIENQYYDFLSMHNYFWVPEALAAFDIPDLACLISPAHFLFVDPVDTMGDAISSPLPAKDWQRVKAFYRVLKAEKKLWFRTSNGNEEKLQKIVGEFLRSL